MCQTQNERDTKSLFFSFLFSFFNSACLFPPFFDWLLLLVLHFSPPFLFFFFCVDNDTLNGTPHTHTHNKKRERERKENECARDFFFDVQKDFDIKRWRRRRRRSCRRISTRAVHLPGCFHRPQRTSRFEARQNIIGFVVLATRTRRTRTQTKKLRDGKRSCPGRRP